MKKRFTKIGALILSAVMLGGTILGGCGASDNKEAGSETVSKETQTAAAEADSNFNAEGLPTVSYTHLCGGQDRPVFTYSWIRPVWRERIRTGLISRI